MDQIKIGGLIATCRKEKKLTQLQLAERLNVTDKAVSTWENDIKTPRTGMLKALAAYFGIMDKADCRAILEKIMTDDTLGEVQPYFAHFLLEAIYRNDLRDAYTLQILEAWKAPVKECPYGLAEGFIKPEPTYSFDHSHAWGGTPLYSMPKALTGLEILEAGYKKISLNPSLLGLENAVTEIPTPYGMITVTQQGSAVKYDIPEGIEVE